MTSKRNIAFVLAITALCIAIIALSQASAISTPFITSVSSDFHVTASQLFLNSLSLTHANITDWGSSTSSFLTSSSNLNASNINTGTVGSTYLPTITYGMTNFANQALLTSSSPSFSGITLGSYTLSSLQANNEVPNSLQWAGASFGSYLNQAVLTTSSPTFAGLTLSGTGIDIYLYGNLGNAAQIAFCNEPSNAWMAFPDYTNTLYFQPNGAGVWNFYCDSGKNVLQLYSNGNVVIAGTIQPSGGYLSADGSTGYSGTFTISGTSQSLTFKNGLLISHSP